MMPSSFFGFVTSVKEFDSRDTNARRIITNTSLIAAFYLLKIDNRTNKSLMQLSQY